MAFDTTEVETQISDDLMRIHFDSYGRAAAGARTYLFEDDVICFLDEIELLPNEQLLVDDGQAEAVLNVRHKFQQAIEPTFVSAVERATGRKVAKFLSFTALDPNFSVEIFRLEPH